MKIAITGGAGFIGSHLATAYLDAGHDVIIIDNLVYGQQQEHAIDQRARFYHVDIRDRRLHAIFQHERPDIVSHHVAYSQERDTYAPSQEQTLAQADLHVRGLLHVLDACVNAAVKKIIFASGGNDLYANTNERPTHVIHEDDPLYPRNAQDVGKLSGEWYVRYYTQQYHLEHTILRYADVYGEDSLYEQRPAHPLTTMIDALQQQQRPVIRGEINTLRDHIFIDDISSANLALLKRGHNQTLNICTGLGCSLTQLYQMVAHIMESHLTPLYVHTIHPTTHTQSETQSPLAQWNDDIGAEAPVHVLDNSRARQLLHWRNATTLAAGINLAIQRLNTQPEHILIERDIERDTDKVQIVIGAARPAQTTTHTAHLAHA
ncbi:NAD-dependent epimerase/dehydratase family protein [Ktedonobacteria bacterium brp13]|nr:NAD-dependent epimerase/dehydratase family protein [Ktedonobacteria bacterium brp13]